MWATISAMVAHMIVAQQMLTIGVHLSRISSWAILIAVSVSQQRL